MVGTGMIAKVHSAAYSLVPVYFPSAAAMPEKTAVCDIDMVTAQQGALRLGWKGAVGSYRELLDRDDIDLVDITTPNHLHADMAIAAAEAGKMIVCEKPLSTDLAGAHAMAAAARQAGVRTAVNFHKRRIPAVSYARALVASGELGKLLMFHGTYRQHFGLLPLPPGNWRHSRGAMGSLLGEVGSHLIDLARFLVGDFESVCGLSDRHADAKPDEVDFTTVWTAQLANKVLGLKSVEKHLVKVTASDSRSTAPRAQFGGTTGMRRCWKSVANRRQVPTEGSPQYGWGQHIHLGTFSASSRKTVWSTPKLLKSTTSFSPS
jgi:predicted dehydrogenase